MSSVKAMDDVSEKILNLAKRIPGGISNDIIRMHFSGNSVGVQALTNAINYLIAADRLEVFKENETLLFKYKPPLHPEVSVQLTNAEEKLIYNEIERSGAGGLTGLQIRRNLNLKDVQLVKILKSMESKQLIKSIKPINTPNKKVYVLYNLDVDSTLTGGPWYTGQEFETQFVEILQQQCLKFLKHKLDESERVDVANPQLRFKSGCVSVPQVHKFINDLNISRVKLKFSDIEDILYACVLDNAARKIIEPDGTVYFRAQRSYLTDSGSDNAICLRCLQFKVCGNGLPINPKSCEYMDKWLEF